MDVKFPRTAIVHCMVELSARKNMFTDTSMCSAMRIIQCALICQKWKEYNFRSNSVCFKRIEKREISILTESNRSKLGAHGEGDANMSVSKLNRSLHALAILAVLAEQKKNGTKPRARVAR